MSYKFIPELRIIFDREMVHPGSGLADSLVSAWKDTTGKTIAWSYTDETGGWIYWTGIARFVFEKTINRVTVYASPEAGHDFINQIYLESTLPFILNLRGFEVLHASAVLSSSGVIAFCAPSGTGKSTLAFALHSLGYPVWADDAVVFHRVNKLFTCEPIPFNLRLYPEMITVVEGHFKSVSESLINTRVEDFDAQPLAAICLMERLQIENADSLPRIRKLDIQNAFTNLLPHVYQFDQNNLLRKRQMMLAYIDLVAAVPIYKISYPNGLDVLHNLLIELERKIISNNN